MNGLLDYSYASLNQYPMQFAYRRLSKNSQMKETFHSHRGLEVLLIHQGDGIMIVNNESYPLQAGMICIFQPFQLHHVQLDRIEGKTFERSLITFEPTLFENYFANWPNLHAFYRYICHSKLEQPCIYDVEEQGEVPLLFQLMQSRLPTLTETNQLEEISLFIVSLFRALQPLWHHEQANGKPFTSRKSHHVEHILKWIEQHYMHPFQLNEMAGDLHLSPFHLSHLFKETVGINLTDYIATRRTHQAIILLTTTDKPVSLIAETVGFRNVSYFCKFFKNNTGSTPYQYRKKWSDHT